MEDMKMIVKTICDGKERIYAPKMMFKNKDRNYPMPNNPENFPEFAYRTSSKGWIDFLNIYGVVQSTVIKECPTEWYEIFLINNGRKNNMTEDVLGAAQKI